MNRKKPFICLYFHYDRVVDNHIHAEAGVDAYISINHRSIHLAFDRKPPDTKFTSKTLLVDGFKETWPKGAMNREGGINDLSRNKIFCVRRLGQLRISASWWCIEGTHLRFIVSNNDHGLFRTKIPKIFHNQ